MQAHRPDQKRLGGQTGGQGTIEERILAQQKRKAPLAESMYSGSVGRKQPLFSESDLPELRKSLSK
jgi:SNF2 family DNA or RNA helicase